MRQFQFSAWITRLFSSRMAYQDSDRETLLVFLNSFLRKFEGTQLTKHFETMLVCCSLRQE